MSGFDFVPPGSTAPKVDPADLPGQIEAVAAIRAMGLEPVPHVPARFVRDRDDLAGRLDAFARRV